VIGVERRNTMPPGIIRAVVRCPYTLKPKHIDIEARSELEVRREDQQWPILADSEVSVLG